MPLSYLKELKLKSVFHLWEIKYVQDDSLFGHVINSGMIDDVELIEIWIRNSIQGSVIEDLIITKIN